MASSREDLARAVIEGCCYALRDITDRFAALGLPAKEIRVVGGGSRSALWMQLKADITGCPVRAVEVPEATALGAGLLAAVGARSFTSLSEAVTAAVKVSADPLLPNPDHQSVYADAYRTYRALFDGIEKATA
jgi:xylulokinase